MSENLKLYRSANHDKTPIFHKPFYLDSVAPNDWDVCIVEKGGKIIASMPYVLKRVKALGIISDPPLTQYLGPWIWKEEEQPSLPVSKYYKLINELYSQLPLHDHIEQSWHYSLDNCLPLHWDDYKTSIRYTYQMPIGRDSESLRKEFNSNAKRNLKKASEQLQLKNIVDFSIFYEIIEATFERKNTENPYNAKMFSELDKACQFNDSRLIIGAYDDSNELCGAIYLIWDAYNVYYLAGGVREEKKRTGAIHLLFSKAFDKANQLNKIFDFEGSMIPEVELFFRSFGSVPKSYCHLSKINSKKLKMKYLVSDMMKLIVK